MGRTTVAIYALAAPTTALIFFIRVCAVYNNSRLPVIFFTLCWLVLAGCYAYNAILAFPDIVHVGVGGQCAILLHGRIGGPSYTV